MFLLAYGKNSMQGSDTGKMYKLVWAVGFNTNGPSNAANWKFENGFVRNNVSQWYQQQNACFSKGLLIMEVRQQHLFKPN